MATIFAHFTKPTQMKKKIYLAFLLLAYYSYSQGPPPPGLPDVPPAAPINQEISVLLAAGIVLGLYSINKKK